MLAKRLNIMFYSELTGEQIILPINPENIQLKYEKETESYNIIGFGEINLMGHKKPMRIKFSHFLPEDDSIFNTSSGIMYRINNDTKYAEYNYSSDRAVEILKRWAQEKIIVRLVIDEEININCMVSYFSQTIRENTASKPYILEVIEYRNPLIKSESAYGLYERTTIQARPKTLVMKKGDTLYSLSSKYGVDYKKLALLNNIDDVNKEMPGKTLSLIGV